MSIGDTASIVIDRNCRITMRDGVALTADVYRPASGAWPTLVTRTPYGKSPYPDNFVSLDPIFAAEMGFAVVIQDVRGRGRSEGAFQPFVEIRDGFDTVEWAAAQPWSNGRVGTFGSSYMGASAIQAAVSAPPSLEGFASLQSSSDYFEGRSYWGGAFELGSLVSSSMGAMAVDALLRIEDVSTTRALRASQRRILDDLPKIPVPFPLQERLGGMDGALGQLTPWFFDWLEHDQDDEYWHQISMENKYSMVSVPGLHITSWFDAMLGGVLRNYVGLVSESATSEAREDQRLIIGPWFHYALRGFSVDATRVGDVSFGTAAAINLDHLQLTWFRERLTESGSRKSVSPVRIFVMGANYWRNENEWPLARTQYRDLYLSSSGRAATDPDSGRLLWSEPSEIASDEYSYDPTNPVFTTGGAHLVLSPISVHGPADQRELQDRSDVLTYSSDVILDDLEVTGFVSVELWVTTSALSTDFTACLVDVWPGGRAISVCDGIRRLPPTDVDSTPRKIVIDLGATSQVFKQGHRIRLSVSSSNFPRFDPNPNTGARSFDSDGYVVARQHVFHGAEWKSRILLPTIPALPESSTD
ncbi:MAG: CocE/NonD family hydrolase [Acidimicrobiales bacterium]